MLLILRLRGQLDGRIVTSRKYVLKKKSLVRAPAILRNKVGKRQFRPEAPRNDSPDIPPGESQFTITTNPKIAVYKIFIVF